MGNSMSDAGRAAVTQLLEGATDVERRAALAQLPALPDPDKDAVADLLVEQLKAAEDGWRRTWCASGLAALNRPDTVAAVAARLSPSREEFEWVRYWASIALAKMRPPDLKKQLLKARRDPHPLVRAVGLRLLIESGFEDGYAEELIAMARRRRSDDRWAACKALRQAAGHHALRESVESRFIPVLVACLLDGDEYVDSRFQAAVALGDIEHKWPEAIGALHRVLEDGLPNDWLRRACVDALRHLRKPEAREALLFALRDADAEIRARAADALKEALGPSEAAAYLADQLLRADRHPPELLDALRRIDQRMASRVMTENVLHPDPKVAERARLILVQLGGEDAMRVLQRQREEAVTAYTSLLKSADAQIVQQLEGLMKQARSAFSLTMWMHATIFVLGVVVLVASLYVTLSQGFDTFERFVGVGGAAGSLVVLLTLFYRDPLKNIRDSVSNLVKVNVVFTGYMRQINQIDATFKQSFLSAGGFGPDDMLQTVGQIRDAVKEAMSQVKEHLG